MPAVRLELLCNTLNHPAGGSTGEGGWPATTCLLAISTGEEDANEAFLDLLGRTSYQLHEAEALWETTHGAEPSA